MLMKTWYRELGTRKGRGGSEEKRYIKLECDMKTIVSVYAETGGYAQKDIEYIHIFKKYISGNTLQSGGRLVIVKVFLGRNTIFCFYLNLYY